VVQECLALGRLGLKTAVAVDRPNVAAFTANYPELTAGDGALRVFEGVDDLVALGSEFDILVATINHSAFDLAAARRRASFQPAYYVQDYEPLFYPPGSPAWDKARGSYTAMADAVLFAKTRWIVDMVYENHGASVSKVEPSLDHAVFYPALRRSKPALTVTAMLRPNTPRRAPLRTLRILHAIHRRYGAEVRLQVFGAEPSELNALGLELPEDAVNFGALRRTQVPPLLRDTDLFLDLSDYQAFGRTALEAMACGAVAIVPLLGGAGEFARDGRNSFVVDTRSDEAILEAAHRFVTLEDRTRDAMVLSALDTAAGYSVHRAALSQLKLFKRMLD
jgi:hypothetical protein